jgi:nucleoside-diphosphate-sugar epimerase
MQRIAILGASSQIAKDLVASFAHHASHAPLLYVRDVAAAQRWQASRGLAFPVHTYAEYGRAPHDAVINFVGVGDPQRAAQMGGDIFAITQQYDDLVLDGLRRHPERRYIFLSSGAAYGSTFLEPAGPDTRAAIAINALQPQEYYSAAKLHAECKHRALPQLAITDLRVFNYFSRSQDLDARFFITDILRAVRDDTVLRTSGDFMVRDFLHPEDFHQLVCRVLEGPHANQALDCYSRGTIDKPTLLAMMARRFGLRYEIAEGGQAVVNATGAKPHYYSLRRDAEALGYAPAYSSEDGIALETAAILDSLPKEEE